MTSIRFLSERNLIRRLFFHKIIKSKIKCGLSYTSSDVFVYVILLILVIVIISNYASERGHGPYYGVENGPHRGT